MPGWVSLTREAPCNPVGRIAQLDRVADRQLAAVARMGDRPWVRTGVGERAAGEDLNVGAAARLDAVGHRDSDYGAAVAVVAHLQRGGELAGQHGHDTAAKRGRAAGASGANSSSADLVHGEPAAVDRDLVALTARLEVGSQQPCRVEAADDAAGQ